MCPTFFPTLTLNNRLKQSRDPHRSSIDQYAHITTHGKLKPKNRCISKNRLCAKKWKYSLKAAVYSPFPSCRATMWRHGSAVTIYTRAGGRDSSCSLLLNRGGATEERRPTLLFRRSRRRDILILGLVHRDVSHYTASGLPSFRKWQEWDFSVMMRSKKMWPFLTSIWPF